MSLAGGRGGGLKGKNIEGKMFEGEMIEMVTMFEALFKVCAFGAFRFFGPLDLEVKASRGWTLILIL